jgi:hypothetical protein
MNPNKMPTDSKSVFCIFHLAPDKKVAWHDEKGFPVTYSTKQEAVKEICDDMREHIAQIEEGDRDLEDGVGFEDWIEEVELWPDGTVTDEDGNTYGKRN